MKFTWKMIIAVTVLLALALSLGSYLLVSDAFSSQLKAAIEDSQKDLRMFTLTVQALVSGQSVFAFQKQPKELLQSILRENNLSSSYQFRVTDEAGNLIYLTSQIALLPTGTCDDELETTIVRQDETVYLLSRQKATLLEATYLIESCNEVTSIFTAAQENLRRSRLIMAAILTVCVLITTLFTMLLTQPIRRISRTAKQLSNGHYERRVSVRSRDELGQLAQDFNSMADSLEHKIWELNDAVERQKEFTASFAHELKTPLTSVIGYADTLRSRQLPPRLQMDAANYIFKEGRRLEAMSFALLDLFALEKEAPELLPCSILRLVQETADSVAYPLRQKHISLELRVEDCTLPLAGELLKTLLYNLIDNARKASEEGSKILLLGAQTEHGYRLSVIDRGRGIPADQLKRITEPFYMVDKSRARAEGGAGLGLALCRKIAEVHHARLTFRSEPGKGTAATLELGGDGE